MNVQFNQAAGLEIDLKPNGQVKGQFDVKSFKPPLYVSRSQQPITPATEFGKGPTPSPVYCQSVHFIHPSGSDTDRTVAFKSDGYSQNQSGHARFFLFASCALACPAPKRWGAKSTPPYCLQPSISCTIVARICGDLALSTANQMAPATM